MSSAKLTSPIKDLVQSVVDNDSSLSGKTENDKAEVEGWIEKVGEGSVVKPDNYKDLESTLTPRTYIATNYLSAADVALYGALHPILSKLEPAQYYSHPSITRYFDHIQSCPSVRKSADALSSYPVVKFDFEDAPKLERTVEPPKKKDKAPKAAAETTNAPASTEAPKEVEQNPQKEKKKEKAAAQPQEGGKKADKKAASGGKTKTPAPDDGEPVPSMIDLRVGHILDVKKHPDADGLYIEQIDLGEETGPRTVVSGLVNYIPIEQMQNKWLVAVCNLKPANMRGVKSFAMVLCASSKDGKEGGIELIQPPANSLKPGERVYFEGEEFENAEPLPQLNPKKKIFEAIQPGFITLGTREAAWVNPATKSVHRIRTKDGVCVAPTLIGASLS
ncbi:nucleic acid-binding protein [Marasmius fiardii PR-910]|nr:nucleic acid-binding protein [Marasmius fiardii PR-910]